MKRPARTTIRANDALTVVHRQQHPGDALLGQRDRNDPLTTEPLTEKSLFNCARRLYGKNAGQRMRSFRAPGIDRGDVQDRDQSSVDAEDRRTGTAQVFVPRAKMLPPVNGDRPLLDDAGTDTVRALELLRPHAAEPGPPVPELVRFRLFAAMLDG